MPGKPITMDDIRALASKSRNRGGFETRVKNFADSGEPFTQNIMDELEFQGKDGQIVTNSLRRNIKIHAPHVKALYDKDRNVVVLYNPTIELEEDES